MARYRAHYITDGDRTLSVDHFVAEDDVAAVSFAAQVYRSAVGKPCEIWQDQRLVDVLMTSALH